MTLVPTEGLGTYESPRRARVIEKRDPTAATQAVAWQSPGHPMIANWDAQNALTFGFYANTFVYRCIQCKAVDMAGLPFRVGADPDKPNDYDKNHPLAKLLGPPPFGPNITTSARQFWAWTIAQYYATGRWAWELELGARDLPIALWPLPAPYLKTIPTQSGAQYFSSFKFGKPGQQRDLPANRVFYHWKPRQDDWRQPESVLDAARLDISVAVMQDRYDYAFLRNDARPAALMIYEGFETEAEDRAFKRRFQNDYGGPDNAGRMAFVEADRDDSGSVAGALDIKVLGLTQKDARFIERYEAKLRAICVAFGVPLTRLGDASNRTFANAGEETFVYWTSLIPDLNDFADAVNINLAPLFGDNVGWFDLSKVDALKPPNKYSVPEAIQAYEAQLITKNEARVTMGEVEIPGGDVFTADPAAVPTPVEPAPGAGGGRTPPHAYQDLSQSGKCDVCGMPMSKHPKMVTGPHPWPDSIGMAKQTEERAQQRRARAVIASSVQVDHFENAFTRAFKRLFTRQASETLRRLEGKRGRQALREVRAEPDAIFNRRHWTDITAQDARDLIEGVFAAGAGRIAGEFGVSFDVHAPYVQEFIKARANKLASQMTDTTYGQITDALAQGASAGETIAEIADRVREVFANADSQRAEMIARTEVISAYNGSAATVAAQLPGDVVGGQEWIAVEDERTRPEHAAADGEIVGIGEAFIGTGEPMAYPGDPNGSPGNVINCRCTVAFLTPDEMDERCARIEKRTALALLAMIRPGQFDELAVRRALREGRAA